MEGKRETGDEPVRANRRKQLDWDNVDWNRIKCQVEKMQQEIFRDAQTNNFRELSLGCLCNWVRLENSLQTMQSKWQ
ncbi:MAG TPA: hypothetical protein VKM55_17695 [Candidatus Lokiarchaeia archaeon]|nr:hypothetical protein [Candidatus Lokiarchaeia archaeon]